MSEKQIQTNFINNLISYGWKFNKTIKNNNSIKKRFLEILKIRNKDTFNNAKINDLSKSESERFFSNLLRGNNPSQYRDILLDEKISLKLDNGKNIYINIFDSKDHSNNIFEVAEEVTLDIDNKRMDILLLINGIPLTNIELKAEHVTHKDAIGQLKEYSKRYTSMFNFIELLVASNNRETVYFANNQQIKDEYIFNFSNNKNENINELATFTREFLDPSKYHRYISNYIVNKRDVPLLLAIRGYQLHENQPAY